MNRNTRPNDAELLHQAVNVLHETGMTPRELAEQVKALRTIAKMRLDGETLDGEEDEGDDPHEMTIDDAFESIHGAVMLARDTLSKYQPTTPA